MPDHTNPMRTNDVVMLAVGGLLLSSAFQQAEGMATDATRRGVIRTLDNTMARWHRRTSTASSTIEIVIGGIVVVWALKRIGRDLLAEAREHL